MQSVDAPAFFVSDNISIMQFNGEFVNIDRVGLIDLRSGTKTLLFVVYLWLRSLSPPPAHLLDSLTFLFRRLCSS